MSRFGLTCLRTLGPAMHESDVRQEGPGQSRGGLSSKRTCLLLSACVACGCACAPSPSPFDTHGPNAFATSQLGDFMIAVATVVFTGVLVFLLLALFRRHQNRPFNRAAQDDRGGIAVIIVGGIALPLLTLTILAVLTVRTLITLAAPPTPAALTVSVIGHQYWWEVRYPDVGVVTANEIHVPAGSPVNLEVTSTDVIHSFHSFWVPQLMGKLDTIPGQTNRSWFEADQPGTYRGQCAEFCGQQHAQMAFQVVADPPDQFTTWLTNQQQPAAEPSDPTAAAGEQAFARVGCITCHTIRTGQSPTGGTLGPDLTHLASRQTIAAGTLPNTRGSLGGWIANPQAIKPGNKMPILNIDSATLQSLIAYLETLQ